jgi:hypothetical protein
LRSAVVGIVYADVSAARVMGSLKQCSAVDPQVLVEHGPMEALGETVALWRAESLRAVLDLFELQEQFVPDANPVARRTPNRCPRGSSAPEPPVPQRLAAPPCSGGAPRSPATCWCRGVPRHAASGSPDPSVHTPWKGTGAATVHREAVGLERQHPLVHDRTCGSWHSIAP